MWRRDSSHTVPLALGQVARHAPVWPQRPRVRHRDWSMLLWLRGAYVSIAGVLARFIAMFSAAALPRLDEQLQIAFVGEPQFAPHLLSSVSYRRGGCLKEDLLNSRVGMSRRVTGLVALQSMPPRTVSPLLHALLSDPLDDIRLLAYGMLDKLEQALTQRILAERTKLGQPLSGEERYRIDKTLAELYSELIYARLVQGDVYINAADQATFHAANALRTHPGDAALWRLRARLALDARRLDEAETMFARAIECGFPRERILPYLAEVAYLRRDYVRVRRLFNEMKVIPPPLLAPVVAYWNA